MASPVSTEQREGNSSAGGSTEGWVIVILVVLLVGGMLVFSFYPYPDGKQPEAFEFIVFWLRELLILLALLVALVAGAWARLFKRKPR